MRPHPRIRKTVKWGGAVVCAVLCIFWLGCEWLWLRNANAWTCEVSTAPWGVAVLEHRVMPHSFTRAQLLSGTLGPNAHTLPHGLTDRLRPVVFGPSPFGQPSVVVVALPLWMPLFLAAIPTVVAWRLDTRARHRARLGMCRNCNYPRAGLAPSAVCPECGAAPAIASSK